MSGPNWSKLARALKSRGLQPRVNIRYPEQALNLYFLPFGDLRTRVMLKTSSKT